MEDEETKYEWKTVSLGFTITREEMEGDPYHIHYDPYTLEIFGVGCGSKYALTHREKYFNVQAIDELDALKKYQESKK